ncbi:hypothetical protein EHO61_01625 [Leptospira fluminis]|uniref:DUF2846 domain-containing protein n=1 Tax=Leptospira fluminis TaxID=2484979 RepID=A0A4R9GU55_9LEPT|nr:hypothetical protein [Leptospira fluminis]TGK21961.1 hypothetical protein EHO61_01625 [Leptospira fluminis]
MKNLNAFLFPCLFLFAFCSCASTSKFEKLEEPSSGKSLLYVLRPAQTALSLWSFPVELFRYEGPFQNGKRSSIAKLSMDSADFFSMELRPGFYSLVCRDMDKIFYAKEGGRIFLLIQLFHRGTFSVPGIFIKNAESEESIRFLLEGARMNRTNPIGE